MIYADHAATAPLLPCARAAMEPYLTEEFSKPSSQYRAGRKAHRDMELARRWCLSSTPTTRSEPSSR